jgi:hypothetical protein
MQGTEQLCSQARKALSVQYFVIVFKNTASEELLQSNSNMRAICMFVREHREEKERESAP